MLIAGAGLTGLSTAVMLARAGRPPVVVEMDQAGSGTTGHSSAKVSLLQGSMLQRLRDHVGPDTLRAYVEANRAGQDWLREVMSAHGTKPEVRTAMATRRPRRVLPRSSVSASPRARPDSTSSSGPSRSSRSSSPTPSAWSTSFRSTLSARSRLSSLSLLLALTLIGHNLVSLHAWHTKRGLPEPWQVHLGEPIDDRPLGKATRTRGRRKHRGD